MIDTLYKNISQLPTLAPNPTTNEVFTKLYQLCTKNERLQANFSMSSLQKLCWYAEYEMEKYVCGLLLKSQNPKKALQNFQYYGNYEQLAQLEFSLLQCQSTIKKILFVWWGPLPLSSIILAEKYNIHSTILDIDQEAIQASTQLVKKLWLEHKIKIIHKNILDFHSQKVFDAVILANLIFLETPEEDVYKHLQHLRIQQFLFRSSHANREFLYKKLSLELLEKYFAIEHITHPKNQLVNSIIISKKYDLPPI